MNLLRKIQQIMADAQFHADEAVRQWQLTHPNSGSPEWLDRKDIFASSAWVDYLFPELSSRQRDLLLLLHWHRKFLIKLVRIRRDALAQPDLTRLEQTTVKTEVTYMRLVERVRNTLSERELKPLQIEILASEFFGIPLITALE
ncbi:MAG TPA: hypothetical protein P5186_19070 [Candidatus Paceibacterota bacterium]|nr:hypothetical protein [Verrucomicrobiota bacterium]HRY50158.1 hypothetical protein [Candidatus Paceibacterota bacterium]HSA01545.1 hypothetical protein [Candidatus Paceibacterota bacterium]